MCSYVFSGLYVVIKSMYKSSVLQCCLLSITYQVIIKLDLFYVQFSFHLCLVLSACVCEECG